MLRFLKWSFVALLAGGMLQSNAVQAKTVEEGVPVFPSSINVRDFGAKGDGVADDTRAIQRAVNESVRQYNRRSVYVKHWDRNLRGSTYNPHREVVFPAGEYRITKPILFQRFASVRGVGKAVIRQENPALDVFYFHQSWQAQVENLHFDGGKTQLRFYTQNNDNSKIGIDDCTFSNSTGYAVECRSFMEKALAHIRPRVRPWAPYLVKWEDGYPLLTPNTAQDLRSWYNSTIFSLANSRFERCIGTVDLSCDTSVVRDSEIIASPQSEGAIINFGGGSKSHLYRIAANAPTGMKPQAYWIADQGILSVRESSFENAGEKGMGFIRINSFPQSFGWACIVVDDTRLKVAGSRENAVIWCAQNGLPSVLSLTRIREVSGKPVQAMARQASIESAQIPLLGTTLKQVPLQAQYKIQMAGNSANINQELPGALEVFREKSLPQEVRQGLVVPEIQWHYNELEQAYSQVLLAERFGVDTDPDTDDSQSIQKLFDEAAKIGNCLVVFPGSIYKLSKTIELPAQVKVRGAGMPIFVQENPALDLFNIANTEEAAFKNCTFSGGRNGLNISTASEVPVKIGFQNCNFFDQNNIAINCLSGDGRPSTANQTELLYENGSLGAVQGLVTNASRVLIDTFWPANDPRLNDKAYLENRGGAMCVQHMLSVPMLWAGARADKTPARIKDWPYSRNIRWIDNWGQLYVADSRFGGEGGGMCNIYNRSQSGTVYVNGGIARFVNGASRLTMLYMEKEPRKAVLENISTNPLRVETSSLTLNASGNAAKNVWIVASMTPSREVKAAN